MKKTFKFIGIIAILAIIAIGFVACSNDTTYDDTPVAYRGTWNGQGSNSGRDIIVSTTDIKFDYGSGNSFTMGQFIITSATNEGSTNGDYPNGRRFEGVITAITGNGNGNSVGDSAGTTLYIHTDGTRLLPMSDNNNAGNHYAKQ